MQTIHIEVMNPKVQKLLYDLAELKLIRMISPASKNLLLDSDVTDTHLASEHVLAKDWLNPQEDEAWKDL
ncbi:MAG: hypothetical protein LBT42_00535 [Tannerella sp.]|jgi:hypothetical protein|nr:hypothetical protein [Tannerella sp.]